MLLALDSTTGTPLAEQIAAQVRGGVARGEIRPGERLPSARDLGVSLGVNMHTVLRAYAALRDEGLLDLRRGRGAVIRGSTRPEFEALSVLARDLLDRARHLGLSTDDVITLIRRSTP